jgi:hypothetical protein
MLFLNDFVQISEKVGATPKKKEETKGPENLSCWERLLKG